MAKRSQDIRQVSFVVTVAYSVSEWALEYHMDPDDTEALDEDVLSLMSQQLTECYHRTESNLVKWVLWAPRRAHLTHALRGVRGN